MGQPDDAETKTDAPTPDDLPWELDVTTAREPARAHHTARPQRAPKPAKRGRFHRPELESPWERLAGNRIAHVIGGVVLVGGTATLVVLALT